jgi:redox-sensing transcriptional repressor
MPETITTQLQESVVPEPTLRRLPLYHRILKEVLGRGCERVSCTEIGQALSLDPTQVRKDLEFTGVAGRPRVGYGTKELIAGIERFLGWTNVNEAFLVGAGNMGAALMGYPRFSDYGLNIVAAFDSDPQKVGRTIHGKEVLPLSKLPSLAQRMHILIGIITVPDSAAQEVADLMVAGGILAIWNFAPAQLRVPEHLVVHNENLYCSLASLSQKLAKRLRGQDLKRADAPSAEAVRGV